MFYIQSIITESESSSKSWLHEALGYLAMIPLYIHITKLVPLMQAVLPESVSCDVEEFGSILKFVVWSFLLALQVIFVIQYIKAKSQLPEDNRNTWAFAAINICSLNIPAFRNSFPNFWKSAHKELERDDITLEEISELELNARSSAFVRFGVPMFFGLFYSALTATATWLQVLNFHLKLPAEILAIDIGIFTIKLDVLFLFFAKANEFLASLPGFSLTMMSISTLCLYILFLWRYSLYPHILVKWLH